MTPAERRLANDAKAMYIRNHPTPPNLSKNAAENFKFRRNMNAWAHALAVVATSSAPMRPSSGPAGRPHGLVGKKTTTGKKSLRNRLSKPGNRYAHRMS